MIKVLQYDCFLVTLKITPLLASNIAPFYDTSLLMPHKNAKFQNSVTDFLL